jgi:phosphoserine phosphatase
MRSPGATVLKLVALDMDGTLVDVDSSVAAVHHHFDDHNAEGLRDFMAGRIDDHEFIRTDVRIWQRHAPDLTVEDLEVILARVPIMPGAATLIQGLRARGVRTAIISGGIDLLAHRVARELGIDLSLANGFRVDKDGRLTGEGIIRVPVKQKQEVLAGLQHQLGIGIPDTASVGNSEIDVGLFRRSRVGIAFLPADEDVRKAATHVVTQKDLGEVLQLLADFPDP